MWPWVYREKKSSQKLNYPFQKPCCSRKKLNFKYIPLISLTHSVHSGYDWPRRPSVWDSPWRKEGCRGGWKWSAWPQRSVGWSSARDLTSSWWLHPSASPRLLPADLQHLWTTNIDYDLKMSTRGFIQIMCPFICLLKPWHKWQVMSMNKCNDAKGQTLRKDKPK